MEEAEKKEKQLEHSLNQARSEWEARFKEYQLREETKNKQLTVQLTEKTERLNELTEVHQRLSEEMKSL